MTAAPAVDLSLPGDAQLAAAASPDPHVAAARLTSGDPDRIGELSAGFLDSGTGLDELYRASGQAQRQLAAGYGNDGNPIYDAATHTAALPPGFRDAGTHLHALGRRLGVVAAELRAAIADATARLRELQTRLDGQRRAWAAELDALGGPDRLFPAEAVAGLLARRAVIAAQLQESVNSCGRAVTERVDRYAEILNGCLQLLGEVAPPGVAASIRPHPIVLQPGGIAAEQPRPGLAPLTVLIAGGPSVEIQPPAGGVRLEGVQVDPPAARGPSVEINVPHPPPETQTDRGQAPPVGVHRDAQDGQRDPRPASIDETLAGLRPGRTPPHLEVDTPEELQSVWDELASSGTPVASPYPGEFERLPDGTRIGYRAASKTGGATIDVFKADGTHIKIHLP